MPVLDFEAFLTALPPVYFAATSQISNGISGGRTEIPIPLGTLTLSFAVPAPVTAIQPRPDKVMSAAASFHPAPLTSIMCLEEKHVMQVKDLEERRKYRNQLLQESRGILT